MDEPTKREQLKQIMDTAKNYRSGRVLTTAVDEEIFERFNGKPRAVEEMIREDEVPHAVGRILKTLTAMGYLEQTGGDRFIPTDITRTFLLPDSPLDLRPILKLFHRNYDLWGHLPETLRKGHEVESEVFGEVEFDREFMMAMEARAQFAKADVAEALEPVLSEHDRVLDLGGGTGVFVREILRTNPTVEAVLADLPHVVETARDLSENSTVLDRLSYRVLDFFEDDSYGENYDLILLFSICHMFGAKQNKTLLNRTARALKPGGKLVVRDDVLERGGVGPLESNLFDLHMLLATDTGRTYTLDEYREFFTGAGLKYERQRPVAGQDDLLVAEKPRSRG